MGLIYNEQWLPNTIIQRLAATSAGNGLFRRQNGTIEPQNDSSVISGTITGNGVVTLLTPALHQFLMIAYNAANAVSSTGAFNGDLSFTHADATVSAYRLLLPDLQNNSLLLYFAEDDASKAWSSVSLTTAGGAGQRGTIQSYQTGQIQSILSPSAVAEAIWDEYLIRIIPLLADDVGAMVCAILKPN